MFRLAITLSDDARLALMALARQERRTTQDQAAWLVEQALAVWQAGTAPPMETK